MFLRHASAFSDFNPQTLAAGVSSKENEIYEKIKEKIQDLILNNPLNLKWSQEIVGLGSHGTNRLIDRLKKTGFQVEYTPYQSFEYDRGSTEINPKVCLSLPTEKVSEEDDGYFSDGWSAEFRASKVNAFVQKKYDDQYIFLSEKIKSVMKENNDCRMYRFILSSSYSDTVLSWVTDDLKKADFEVEIKTESSTDYKYGDTKHVKLLICINRFGTEEFPITKAV